MGLDAFSKASETARPDPARDRYLEEDGFPAVPGLVAVDAHTVEIRLVEPYPQLQWVLAMGYTSVYPPEAVAAYGKKFLNHAVGTGAFRVEDYRHGQRLVLVRNPDLPRGDAIRPRRRSRRRRRGCSRTRGSACRRWIA